MLTGPLAPPWLGFHFHKFKTGYLPPVLHARHLFTSRWPVALQGAYRRVVRAALKCTGIHFRA